MKELSIATKERTSMEFDNDSFGFGEKTDQFAISYELLCLLRWLIENEGEEIQNLVERAVARGLQERITHLEHSNDKEIINDAHSSITEFFSILETMLSESFQNQNFQHALEKNLMPAIDHIDPSVCDDTVLQYGIEKTNEKIAKKHSKKEKPQEILLKEILKHWKPGKKSIIN